MTEPATVLYLDMWVGERIQETKLAGIRRFARMAGWQVVPVCEAESRPSGLPRLLSCLNPVGVIVECSASHTDLPPRLFGRVPVVYLNCRRSLYGPHAVRIVHDHKQTVRAAFREILSNRPDFLGFVGYRHRRTWSIFRERAFRALSAEAGKDCRVFPWAQETDAARARRLADWVAALPRKAAVLAANDNTALEVLGAARAAHRAVPCEFTLMGIDNLTERCESCEPALSSVQVDFERAGYLAARALDERLRRRAAPQVETFGALLTVRRESTRGYGRRAPKILEAIAYIRAHACDGLTARAVVAQIGGSRRLAELRFREAVGHSIHDEIESVRMERVLRLLQDRTVGLPVVIDQSGYPSAAALRKAFRLRTGKSLLAWRAANA